MISIKVYSGEAKVPCTEGWERGLGISGLKYFFSKNGLGGSLGSHWKVFHHGTPRNHFQGVVVTFGRRPGSKKELKLGKNSISFFWP